MDLIALAADIESRYRRYLATTFYFKDPDLRRSFEEALSSGSLSKGPYLEATPVFRQGATPRELFTSLADTVPDEGMLAALQGDRPLYKHQDAAIRRSAAGRNVVVASGTGSGKTEAFLYPILLRLYREFQSGLLCPGVRALVLYPMNALANDQRERLGEICARLQNSVSRFSFSFGQYIGETPDDENDARRRAREHIANRLPGELVLRSEMRENPPHILLTNYSMLEYLLLRPKDSPLFDDGRARWWTFIVLDEAHQYRGSRGIEMAMLLRRLKHRLRDGGRSGPFQCTATSATLVGGESDKASVARFASDLFGEEFGPEDVILGESEPIPEPSERGLGPDDYRLLGDALDKGGADVVSQLARLADGFGVSLAGRHDVPEVVGEFLCRDARATRLRKLVTERPYDIREIAETVFGDLPEERRPDALSSLVELLLRGSYPGTSIPLLSARYHVFLRSLEGAFVSYWPIKRVFLDRKAQDGEVAAFEVALCRECGQHYFVGQKGLRAGRLMEPVRDPNHPEFGATFYRPLNAEHDGDEEAGEEEQSEGAQLLLCIRCGEVSRAELSCGHGNSIPVVREKSPDDEDRADQIVRCSACGYGTRGPDPVREVVHGSDGPHAVIATTLHQELPPDRRKVLAFADGRQEAAFFAWYLEDSYKDILSRNLLLRAVRNLCPHAGNGLSPRELAPALRDTLREQNVLAPAAGDLELYREAWRSVYRQFLTDEPRISLEGVGLLRWWIEWPPWFKTPDILADSPWSLTDEDAMALLSALLGTMRAQRAVELRAEERIPLNWDDLGLAGPQKSIKIGNPAKMAGVLSWEGKSGRRTALLTKLLLAKGVPEQQAIEHAIRTLRAIWEDIVRYDESAPTARDRLLVHVGDARRLNPDWWRVKAIEPGDTIFQCGTCGRLQPRAVYSVCTRHGCPGTIRELCTKDLAPNHYRILYEAQLPGRLRVEEHTAQLDHEKAREFQREFRDGKINVLSCSTTFELGVDLGDLDVVFLRNVPPEAFNYVQRVGRAGRRSGHPGFAITYCRRNPHDLYHFADPSRVLSGRIKPPSLALCNGKIVLRHLTAVALSAFFRMHPDRFQTVQSFTCDLCDPSGVADFGTFLAERRDHVESQMRAIVPLGLWDATGLEDGAWVERISGRGSANDGCALMEPSRLYLAEAEVSTDYSNVIRLEEESRSLRDYRTAEWAQRRANTIAAEDVLSFLSRKAVIPKYGFPVDTVELDTQRTLRGQEAAGVALQRDLSIAISEFAPTSKLVANKREWTSCALKKVAAKEWDRFWYVRCPVHNVFERRAWQNETRAPEFAERCCQKMVTDVKYVDPRFGFVADREVRPPRGRPARVFTTRPYFAGFSHQEGERINFGVVTLRSVSPGFLVVLCEGKRGRGFYVCETCGAGFTKRDVPPHRDPYGRDCRGTLALVSLGHEFVTDVLELQFQTKPEGNPDQYWFAYALAYAMVEGAAEILDIPSTDLDATVARAGQHVLPPIILYDNVPGGAGLVARLETREVLRSCLEAAHSRVGGSCGCDEGTSCYGCLRSYRNQFAHQHLQRGPVMRYLQELLQEFNE